MQPFTVEPTVIAKGGPMKMPVVVTDCKDIGGVRFFRASKAASYMPPLMSLPRWDVNNQRILSHTDIFETIVKLRDEAYDRECARRSNSVGDGDDRLESWGSCAAAAGAVRLVRVPRTIQSSLPETILVKCPGSGDAIPET